ncbi:860_t:CDS:2, partial [Racocetra persica]
MGFLDKITNITIVEPNNPQAVVLSTSNPQIVFSKEIAISVTNYVGGQFNSAYGYVGPCSSTILAWVEIVGQPYLVIFDVDNTQVGFAETLWGVPNYEFL